MKIASSIPKWIGRLAYLIGILDITSNIFRPIKLRTHKLHLYVPLFVHSTAFATAFLTSAITIILARGLGRRKRRAWTMSLVILIISLIANGLRFNHQPYEQIGSLLLIILLVIYRKEFYAKSDPTTKLRPIYGFIFTFIVLSFAGILILYFRHGSDIGVPSFKKVIITVLEGFIGITGPVHFRSERVSDAVGITLGTFGIFLIVVPLFLFFRRVAPTARMSLDELEQVKKLIRHDQEQDSLGYFATRLDKNIIWATNQKAGIAYRVQSGVMLASGDPFGEFSLWAEAIENFLEIAKEHAWTPAVMGCSDHGGQIWVEKAEMLAIDIGDEAIINVGNFTLEGRLMSNVRQMVNRIRRKGYSTYTSRWSDLDPKNQQELRGLALKWRYGAPERGFSMSMDRLGSELDEDTFITVAELDGVTKGLLYFVPWTSNRLSLDRMQRERGTDPGVNELMIVNTVEYAREHGISHLSLNFAAFRSLFERAEKISAGPLVRTSRNLIRFSSNFFQVESLYRFNAKFQPEWETRYVLYPKTSDLLAVGWAALRAEKFISSFRSHSVNSKKVESKRN
jgi:lysyl-tRNA synthetase class 2